MAEQLTGAARAVSRALAEPTEHVRAGWITTLSLASLGMWMTSLTPLQVLIPIQLQDITPHHKIAALSLVSAVGAISSGLATPLAGALSDRTTRPLPRGWLGGRRHRWTLSMALAGAASLAVLGHQGTVAGVAILWVVFSAFQNAEYASLSAAIPDHVPVRQRATVAGWVGMPQALGLVLGTVLVVEVFTHTVGGYNALAIALVVLTLPFVLWSPDHVLDRADRQPFSWRELARSYWLSPRQYPDFAWAWLTRFLMSLAIAMGTLYLLYFLRDAVHYAHPSGGLLILILIYTTGVVLTAIVGGVISDRTGRRKRLVVVSGCTIASAAVLLAFVETWTSAIVAAVLYGIGFGAYLAVDQALITQVLPAAVDRAKDLGIINIAIVIPGAIGAAISAPLVSLGGYPSLYAGTAIVAVAGSIFVWKIKSVP
ncbi:MAG: MFS transporter [Actinomycetota bacterium]